MKRTLTRRELLARSKFAAFATPMLWAVGCGEGRVAAKTTVIRGETMGTTYAVRIADPIPDSDPGALKAEIDRVLDRINQQMSTYRSDSELSHFNAAPAGTWEKISPATKKVMETALAISRLTEGAFDPTVGPLVDLWGFGPEASSSFPPTDQVETAMRRVGYAAIKTNASSPAIRKERPGVRLDLSGIAKGFGVDEVTALLEARGIGRYLVEIGGELRGSGSKPDGSPWRIGIEKPQGGREGVHSVVELTEAAIATSGDYRQFFERNGERFCHIVDPRSGEPVSHGLRSVTVLSRSTVEADALSTALMVMGPDSGVRLARDLGIAALFVAGRGDRLVETPTGAFRQYVVA